MTWRSVRTTKNHIFITTGFPLDECIHHLSIHLSIYLFSRDETIISHAQPSCLYPKARSFRTRSRLRTRIWEHECGTCRCTHLHTGQGRAGQRDGRNRERTFVRTIVSRTVNLGFFVLYTYIHMLNGYNGNCLTEVNPSWGYIVSTTSTDSLERSQFFFFVFSLFLLLERCVRHSYFAIRLCSWRKQASKQSGN